jgi:hypothetical protein
MSISIGLPPWLYKALKKVMVAFLWTGSDMVQGGECLVAWSRVQRPLHLGGLGVLDLGFFSIALIAQWLWLRHSNLSHPWTSLPGGEDRLTMTFFNAPVLFRLGDGATFLFWTDPWLRASAWLTLLQTWWAQSRCVRESAKRWRMH